MNKILSIIIPIYNKFNFTKACLNDLSKLPNDHEIIIIDNASTDETNKEILKILDQCDVDESICRMNYFKMNENIFHSKACNRGFIKARGENICFLNNDIRIRSNHASWTKSIIDACNSTKGLVGTTMGQLDKNLNFVKEANEQLSGNSYLSGWCIAAKKDVWMQLKIDDSKQIWNEEFPFYFNDTDLSFRARKKNIPLTIISLPEIVHFGKVSAAQINIPKLYNEGREIFIKKWKSK